MTYPYIRAMDRRLYAAPSRGGGDARSKLDAGESDVDIPGGESLRVIDAKFKRDIERVSKGRLTVRAGNIVPTGA